MKKFLMIIAASAIMATAASAHHMAAYDDAGIYIPEWSPHLLMEF